MRVCRCVRVGVSYFSLSLQRSILSTHAYTHTDVNTHIQTCIHTYMLRKKSILGSEGTETTCTTTRGWEGEGREWKEE